MCSFIIYKYATFHTWILFGFKFNGNFYFGKHRCFDNRSHNHQANSLLFFMSFIVIISIIIIYSRYFSYCFILNPSLISITNFFFFFTFLWDSFKCKLYNCILMQIFAVYKLNFVHALFYSIFDSIFFFSTAPLKTIESVIKLCWAHLYLMRFLTMEFCTFLRKYSYENHKLWMHEMRKKKKQCVKWEENMPRTRLVKQVNKTILSRVHSSFNFIRSCCLNRH